MEEAVKKNVEQVNNVKSTNVAKKRRARKQKDSNKPKRSPSAYLLWMNENREKIKSDNPGISFNDIAVTAGRLWKEVQDKTCWLNKAAQLKEEYLQAMSKYKKSKQENGAGDNTQSQQIDNTQSEQIDNNTQSEQTKNTQSTQAGVSNKQEKKSSSKKPKQKSKTQQDEAV